jgi:hypothetical protein
MVAKVINEIFAFAFFVQLCWYSGLMIRNALCAEDNGQNAIKSRLWAESLFQAIVKGNIRKDLGLREEFIKLQKIISVMTSLSVELESTSNIICHEKSVKAAEWSISGLIIAKSWNETWNQLDLSTEWRNSDSAMGWSKWESECLQKAFELTKMKTFENSGRRNQIQWMMTSADKNHWQTRIKTEFNFRIKLNLNQNFWKSSKPAHNGVVLTTHQWVIISVLTSPWNSEQKLPKNIITFPITGKTIFHRRAFILFSSSPTLASMCWLKRFRGTTKKKNKIKKSRNTRKEGEERAKAFWWSIFKIYDVAGFQYLAAFVKLSR